MRRRFVTVDVFTTTPFAGNHLAVVIDQLGYKNAVLSSTFRIFRAAAAINFVHIPFASLRALREAIQGRVHGARGPGLLREGLAMTAETKCPQYE